MIRLFKKTVSVFLVVAICLMALEVGLRLIGRGPKNTLEGIYDQDGDSFRLKKNIVKKIEWPSFTFTTYTNSLGLRDKSTGELELDGRPYYVFLGASDVFGQGVDFEHSIVGKVTEAAEKRGIKVLNFAMPGHRFPDQDRLFKQFLEKAPYPPERLFYTTNALHIPKFDMPNKGVFVKDGNLYEKATWRSAYLKKMGQAYVAIYTFFKDNMRNIQEKYTNIREEFNIPAFLQIFSKDSRMFKDEEVAALEAYFEDINGVCRRHGIEITYVYLPMIDSYNLNEILKGMGRDPANFDATHYTDIMRNYTNKKGYEFIDARAFLQPYAERGEQLRFSMDPHCNVYCNGLIGQFLVRRIFSDEEGGS